MLLLDIVVDGIGSVARLQLVLVRGTVGRTGRVAVVVVGAGRGGWTLGRGEGRAVGVRGQRAVRTARVLALELLLFGGRCVELISLVLGVGSRRR